MARGSVLPGAERLPGSDVVGPILLTPDAGTAVITTGSRAADSPAFISGYLCAPFGAMEGAQHVSPVTGREQAACTGRAADGGQDFIVVLSTSFDGEAPEPGHVAVMNLSPGNEPVIQPPRVTWPLAGEPVAAASVADGARVAILCLGQAGASALLYVADLRRKKLLVDALPIAAGIELFDGEPSGLAVSRDGNVIYVLISGRALKRPSGIALLYAFGAGAFGQVGAPLELPGVARVSDSPLSVAGDGSCWVATRSPGFGFAYATRVMLTSDGPQKAAEVPFTQVAGPLCIATAPKGPAVAIAVGGRLEIWPSGKSNDLPLVLPDAIAALAWTPEGLFAGAANRLYAIDIQARAPSAIVPFVSGHVTRIALLPAKSLPAPDRDGDGLPPLEEEQRGTSDTDPDSDGDNMHDGVDPLPTTPSARLRAPSLVTFHGEAVGRELRTFVLDVPRGENTRWHVDYDRGAMPWLRIFPLSGAMGEPCYMGIDPASYPDHRVEARGVLILSMGDGRLRRGPKVLGSPASLHIRVAPSPGMLRRVLWILTGAAGEHRLRDPRGEHAMHALAELLAAPPNNFSHLAVSGPYLGTLDPYAVVVIDAAAAAEGLIARPALLDYVAAGGAVLFLGAAGIGGDPWTLSRWLSPIGIRIDATTAVAGLSQTRSEHWLCRHWHNFEIINGAAVTADAPGAALVADEAGHALFLARPYGYGRVAVLAAATPLENGPLHASANRHFANDLFRWLARAGKDVSDLDGDGLPDDVEDLDKNGLWDTGETDFLNPDTDGDGIPDGDEDLDRNGRVDEGETSPLNADSDGDGTLDGADPWPLPPGDAPHVAGLSPNHGPAEGGTAIEITGRNFTQDATVWFGPSPSPSVRRTAADTLLAETPPYEIATGGDVPIRVEEPSTGLSGALPAGFHYTSRTTARLTAATLQAFHVQGQQYRGSITLTLEHPPEVSIGWISVRLKALPEDALRWAKPAPSSAAVQAGRRLIQRQPSPGVLLLAFTPPKRRAAAGEFLSIPWRTTSAWPKTWPIRVVIEEANATVVNGQPIEVQTDGIAIRPAGVPVRSALVRRPRP